MCSLTTRPEAPSPFDQRVIWTIIPQGLFVEECAPLSDAVAFNLRNRSAELAVPSLYTVVTAREGPAKAVFFALHTYLFI